ncbi:DUF4190 domain-containing protein [Quadrisphaera setariae]|uniref:DUF4352 domain-containing protein n=1 Tax=Quadrisphaera setariae TaxID=2593304 RepID=A0A5C8ZDD2_9ACTN|nr:DUF4190 domain-containing protein [Quadrisphaera setariae]TXR55494.1 DUF4352 domain-containing protein [Quadrisphaera setariae]
MSMHQPYVGTPDVRQPTNGWATGAIVTAGVAFIFGWVPVFGLLLGVAAIVLGVVALRRATALSGRGRGLGITSIVLGALAALTSIVITIAAFASGTSTDTAEPAQTASPAASASPSSAAPTSSAAPSAAPSTSAPEPAPTSSAPAPEPPAPAAPAAGIGIPAVSGDLTFTVTSFKCGISRVGSRTFGADAQGQFCQADLSVLNNGQRANYFTSSQATLLNGSGQEFSASSDSIYLDSGAGLFDQINPGNTLSGSLLFDVPKGADLSGLELRDGLFDKPVTVPVR